MRVITAEAVDRALDYAELADRLADGFRAGCDAPRRHHHPVATPDGSGGTLLLMPAWQTGRHIGVKQVTIFPANAARGLPSVMGLYTLLEADTGQPIAVIDGVSLTVRRTAAASALAARFLARPDAERLAMVGAGALAPHLIRAHAAVRPIRRVTIWNHNPDKAARLARAFADDDMDVTATTDLAAAVAQADVISCATLSKQPLVRGAWLKPGAHLDLVGAYLPSMRESDDAAVRAARIFVDTRDGALREGGDIADPLARGVIQSQDVVADLFELCRGAHAGRGGADEITLFKSVGYALEDLVAAELVLDRA